MQCFGELDDPPDYKNKLGDPLPIKLQQNMNEYRKLKGKKVVEASALEAPQTAHVDTEPEHVNIVPGACFASSHEASILELAFSEFDDVASQDTSTRCSDAKLECIQILYDRSNDYMITNHGYMIANHDYMLENRDCADA
jgi:hypothetical protein